MSATISLAPPLEILETHAVIADLATLFDSQAA